jgi:hypothetical protein
MSIECYVPKKFQSKTLTLIDSINGVIDTYMERGFVLTLRQLFYQLVARLIVENTMKSYKRVGSIVNDGRLAGLIDWDGIEDRTRSLREHASWESPSDIISAVASQYREDLWSSQDIRIEAWIEKDALLGVIEGVCRDLRVPYFACRGNNSQSEQRKAGKRYEGYLAQGIKPIVLHLGDHDPNGLDMTRDNRDRLAMFARQGVEVRRLALNMDQVEQHNLPPNPAKETDTRFKAYVQQFGTANCWELDALDPTIIADLIRDEVHDLLDHEAWEAAKVEELNSLKTLRMVSANWTTVENYLNSLEGGQP